MASEAVEDYLKAIFEITSARERASTVEIANCLGVAPASVTGMLRKLADQSPPWVSYTKHRGAVLTKKGRLRALEVIRHHRLLELFLHNSLDYSLDEVHEEAERLEHAISETFEERIAQQLGDPEVDPHGHPIPRKDGTIPKRREVCLVDLNIDQEVTVSRVSDSDAEILKYLSKLGILPGTRLELKEKAPFEGPLILKVEGASETRALGRKVALQIHVVPDQVA